MFKRVLQAIWEAIIRVFAFVSKEIRGTLNQPRLVFSLILGPFFILLLFGVGYRDSPRTLKTLFVVAEGSEIEELVEEYVADLGSSIEYMGTIDDPDTADRRLRNREVDLVIVPPADPVTNWENEEQAKFALYHSEVDPFEEVYIRVLGRRYIEILNQEVLMAALSKSQIEAEGWQAEVATAKEQATAAKEAFAAGDAIAAQDSTQALQSQLNLLKATLGAGAVMAASLEEVGGGSDNASRILTQLESLPQQGDTVASMAQNQADFNEAETVAADIETSLTDLDELLTDFQTISPAILVAPFRSETLNTTLIQIEPMHFFVPAVIALLLQHLSITLAGLSIVREKLGGAMELFRAAPISSLEILIGKYGSYLILTGSMAAILTTLVIVGLDVPQLGLWANYVLIILAVLLASLGMGFNISLSARTHSQAIQYGMLTLLAAIFFSGFFLPLYRLVAAVRVISWLLPATYGTVLLQDAMLRGRPPQLLLMLALLLIGAALFLLAWFRLSRQLARE